LYEKSRINVQRAGVAYIYDSQTATTPLLKQIMQASSRSVLMIVQHLYITAVINGQESLRLEAPCSSQLLEVFDAILSIEQANFIWSCATEFVLSAWHRRSNLYMV
jgi:hypothetical protein